MSGVRKTRHGSKDLNGDERSPPVMICLSTITIQRAIEQKAWTETQASLLTQTGQKSAIPKGDDQTLGLG